MTWFWIVFIIAGVPAFLALIVLLAGLVCAIVSYDPDREEDIFWGDK